MTLFETLLNGLLSFVGTCLALAVNDWLLKNRLVKQFERLEEHIKKTLASRNGQQ